MKNLFFLMPMMIGMMMTSCATSQTRMMASSVRMGATKTEIQKMLGTPTSKSANVLCEKWVYVAQNDENPDLRSSAFLVTFDYHDIVVDYCTVKKTNRQGR